MQSVCGEFEAIVIKGLNESVDIMTDDSTGPLETHNSHKLINHHFIQIQAAIVRMSPTEICVWSLSHHCLSGMYYSAQNALLCTSVVTVRVDMCTVLIKRAPCSNWKLQAPWDTHTHSADRILVSRRPIQSTGYCWSSNSWAMVVTELTVCLWTDTRMNRFVVRNTLKVRTDGSWTLMQHKSCCQKQLCEEQHDLESTTRKCLFSPLCFRE